MGYGRFPGSPGGSSHLPAPFPILERLRAPNEPSSPDAFAIRGSGMPFPDTLVARGGGMPFPDSFVVRGSGMPFSDTFAARGGLTSPDETSPGPSSPCATAPAAFRPSRRALRAARARAARSSGGGGGASGACISGADRGRAASPRRGRRLRRSPSPRRRSRSPSPRRRSRSPVDRIWRGVGDVRAFEGALLAGSDWEFDASEDEGGKDREDLDARSRGRPAGAAAGTAGAGGEEEEAGGGERGLPAVNAPLGGGSWPHPSGAAAKNAPGARSSSVHPRGSEPRAAAVCGSEPNSGTRASHGTPSDAASQERPAQRREAGEPPSGAPAGSRARDPPPVSPSEALGSAVAPSCAAGERGAFESVVGATQDTSSPSEARGGVSKATAAASGLAA